MIEDVFNEQNLREFNPGLYWLEFVNGKTKLVKVERAICDSTARILYLVEDTDKIYNFANVISFRRDSV